jgi:hypothetical protein
MSDSQRDKRTNYLDSAILNSLRQLIELHPVLEQVTRQLPRREVESA